MKTIYFEMIPAAVAIVAICAIVCVYVVSEIQKSKRDENQDR